MPTPTQFFMWYHMCAKAYFLARESEVAQSCPTLCNPMDCSLPGSSVHGIFQARILEWVAISLSRGSSQHRDWTQVSRIAGRLFNIWATRSYTHPIVPTNCLKRVSFLHCFAIIPLLKINRTCMCGYIPGLYSVSLISVYLDTNVTLSWLLYLYNKFWKQVNPLMFFSFKFVWANLDPFHFHLNSRISLSTS